MSNLTIYPDVPRFNDGAADYIVDLATQAINARDRFTIALAGGNTPRPIYARLASAGYRERLDWSKVQVFFGDERCLPVGYAERNDQMARGTWLDRVPIPRAQIHAIPAELGPTAAAEAYHRTLTAEPPFDLTLLGLGEDGHTGCLFPGRNHGGEPATADLLAVFDAPKPPAQRVGMSLARLSRSDRIAVLVLGAGKRAAVRQLQRGDDLPVNRMTPISGIDVFVDRAAAGP